MEVKVIVPGKHADHLLTRRSSRRLFGELLRAGAKIYEYQPAMIHTKALLVDGMWSVVGSTNFDHRSFGINDEVNLAVSDPAIAAAPGGRLRGRPRQQQGRQLLGLVAPVPDRARPRVAGLAAGTQQ